jgi:hypothetical protein
MPPTSTTSTTKYTEPLPNGCSNCGRIGHNARTCANPAKVHLKIGIEIEGRWLNRDTVIARAREAGLTACSDGSVTESPDTRARPYEIQTVPGSLREAIMQLVDFYPDETDQSCGMHVHVSFPSTVLSVLNSQQFFDYYLEQWEAWGRENRVRAGSQFWRRLEGDNDYCVPNHYREQADVTSCDRYVQLNFSAWNEHKTVECRMLPMFRTARLGVLAVQKLIEIYETWLDQHANSVLPAVVVQPETYSAGPVHTDVTLEVNDAGFVQRLAQELEVTEPPPLRPGMVRVAVTPDMSAAVLLQRAREAA